MATVAQVLAVDDAAWHASTIRSLVVLMQKVHLHQYHYFIIGQILILILY